MPSWKALLSGLSKGALCHTFFSTPHHPPFASCTPLALAAISGVILGSSHMDTCHFSNDLKLSQPLVKAHLLPNDE